MAKTMECMRKTVELPAFFPDGTYGAVRSTDATDLERVGVTGLVMNGYHLMRKPGSKTMAALGGLHAFAGLNTMILTDSGGFQVLSLIGQNPKFGEVRKDRIIFSPPEQPQKMILTPEKSIISQFRFGSNIMMCLDYCTLAEEEQQVHTRAVRYTIDWAKTCKKTYKELVRQKKIAHDQRPQLFAIIQGGTDHSLREQCAQELIDIGFDGYGFGGWPLSDTGEMLYDTLEYTASLMPSNKIKYAMGVGKPHEIVRCAAMGYDLFDCVIPTREARNKKLYVFLEGASVFDSQFYENLYMQDVCHRADKRPIDMQCDCLTCQRYSRAYLHHLFMMGEPLAYRLATIHNLRFYMQLMQKIRKGL